MLFFVGLSFWSVPLCRIFCESIGQGNALQTQAGHNPEVVSTMEPLYDHPIAVRFEAEFEKTVSKLFP